VSDRLVTLEIFTYSIAPVEVLTTVSFILTEFLSGISIKSTLNTSALLIIAPKFLGS
jgi:hypothetical protein